MCFGSKRKQDEDQDDLDSPIAYQVLRAEHYRGSPIPGLTFRTRTSIQRHANSAPDPKPQKGNRWPKPHKNYEQYYNAPTGPSSGLWEYPSMPYEYARQNREGEVKVLDEHGKETGDKVDKKWTRTITDGNKKIQGVSYHPHTSRQDHRRAAEVHRSGNVYEYGRDGKGQRQKVVLDPQQQALINSRQKALMKQKQAALKQQQKVLKQQQKTSKQKSNAKR